MYSKGGKEIPLSLVRTDIGCSEGPVNDTGYSWDPNKKTFFLNEIEHGGCNYFRQHLKFDIIPLYSKLYTEKVYEYCDMPILRGRTPVSLRQRKQG